MLDAEQRVTAAEALAHPYFESLHDTEDEPQAQKYDESFDDVDRTLDEWKREWGPRVSCAGGQAQGPGPPPCPGCRFSEERSRRSEGRSRHWVSPGAWSGQHAHPRLGQGPG